MKNSAIFALMKKRKILFLTKAHGEQWCCDGIQAYNISSLPDLSPEQFLSIIGVETDKQSEYNCRFNDSIAKGIYPESPHLEEKEAGMLMFDIDLGNDPLIPLRAFDRVFFISRKSLKPFSDCIEDIRYYIRKYDKVYDVAVKIGMLQVGVFMPKRMPEVCINDIHILGGSLLYDSEADDETL